MSDDGWSNEPITIDGKQYLHKSGVPRKGDIFVNYVDFKPLLARHNDNKGVRVLLKPVEPEPPRFPTSKQFVEPRDIPDSLLCAVELRRQLESERHAVGLLREWSHIAGRATSRTRAFLRARDEGLPWPEGGGT